MKSAYIVKMVKFEPAKKVALIKEIKGLIEGMNLVQVRFESSKAFQFEMLCYSLLLFGGSRSLRKLARGFSSRRFRYLLN